MALGSLVTGNAATSTLPLAAQRFYGLDRDSKIVMLGRHAGNYPLFALVTAGVGLPKSIPTAPISDVEYRILSEHPMATSYRIKGNTGAPGAAAITTTTTYLYLEDNLGVITDANKLVRVGDLLFVPSNQQNQTAAAGTVAALGEYMRVSAINAAGTVVTVVRNHGSSATTANITAGSGNYLDAYSWGEAIGETDRSRDALIHAAQSQTNYLQEFEEPFSVSTTVRKIDLVGGDPFLREQEQKRIKFLEDIEMAFLFGQKSQVFVNGVATYTTQGVVPYILGYTTTYGTYTASADMVSGTGLSRIWVPGSEDNFNQANMMKWLEVWSSEGSDMKVVLHGSGFGTKYLKALEPYLKLDFTAETGYNLGFGMKSLNWNGQLISFRQHPILKGAMANDAHGVDLNYIRRVNLPGDEVQIWKGVNGTGLQDNDSRTIKHAWRAKLGVETTYALAHCSVLGLKNADETLGGLKRTVGTLTPSNT